MKKPSKNYEMPPKVLGWSGLQIKMRQSGYHEQEMLNEDFKMKGEGGMCSKRKRNA